MALKYLELKVKYLSIILNSANTIEVLRDPQLLKEFKEYSIQDSVALYDALAEAQTLYLNNYSTDSAYHNLISFYFST
jgi:hypothetical protein